MVNTYGRTRCPQCKENNSTYRPAEELEKLWAWDNVNCFNCGYEYKHTEVLKKIGVRMTIQKKIFEKLRQEIDSAIDNSIKLYESELTKDEALAVDEWYDLCFLSIKGEDQNSTNDKIKELTHDYEMFLYDKRRRGEL